MGTYPQPPQAPPRWSYTPQDIKSLADQTIQRTKETLDRIAKLKPEECNFESVVVPLSLSGADRQIAESPIFLSNVSTDKELRDACVAADQELEKDSLAAIARLDIYEQLKHAHKNTDFSKLDAPSKRLFDRMILDRKRQGLELPADQREELQTIKNRLSELGIKAKQNFNEENGSLLFTEEELEGLPEYSMKGFERAEEDGVNKYRVSFKMTDFFPTIEYAKNPNTRERLLKAHGNRLANNGPLAKEIYRLRAKMAGMLGYKNWADYKLEVKMAKTSEDVMEFLTDLRTKLAPLGKKEKETLLQLKKDEHESRGIEYDGKLYSWDINYYQRRYLEQTLKLDDNEIMEYFPLMKVLPRVREIYEDLLGVRVIEVPQEEAKLWHPEATLYAAWDKSAFDKDGNRVGPDEKFLGYFGLDIYPRPGKYNHAAVFPIIPSYTKADGSYGYPLSVQVANLAKPGPEALIKHKDLVTYFHEMGHAWHSLCSRTRHAAHHGTSTSRDFVEAPSQMLENWCWTPEQLQRMSSHHVTGKPLPDDLIQRLIKSRHLNTGLFNLRQLFFGFYDMKCHMDPNIEDYAALWNQLKNEIFLVDDETPEIQTFGSFMHSIGGGYDAGYYGYLYSQSFSADMFQTVFAENPMDPEKGAHYRHEILEPGGSREEMDSLIAFLGRKPNNEAFLKSLLGGDGSASESSKL